MNKQSVILTVVFCIIVFCCKKENNSSKDSNVNMYFFRDTTEAYTGGNSYLALNAGYTRSVIRNTFSYDLWVKPTRTINMTDESNECSGAVSVPLANSNQNWALVPINAGWDSMGVGLSIGTNGLMVGEHSEYILVSRLSYTVSINDWVHVAVVYRPDSIFLFLNGENVRSRQTPCSNNAKFVTFGLTGYYYSPDFKGDFDEFRLWDIALTKDQVKYIKDKKLMTIVSGLRYYVNFDNGLFERTLGDIGTDTIHVSGQISDSTNIKISSWTLKRYKGSSISTLIPY